MLLRFEFKNFKSFKNSATLDFIAAKEVGLENGVVCNGGEYVLPVAAIYGANASGKSNVYSAFEYMSIYVIESFGYGDSTSKEKENFLLNDSLRTFAFSDDSDNEGTSFEVYFTVPGDDHTYNYGFCVDNDRIIEEWLNVKARTARKYRTIFYRTADTLDLSGLPRNSRKNVEIALEKKVLVVSLGAKLKIGICKDIRNWFWKNEFADFGDAFNNALMARLLPQGFTEDKKIQQRIVEYLSSFDDSIKGFSVEKVLVEDEDEERYRINTLHEKINSTEFVEIPLRNESAGTQKMFSLYQDLYSVLMCGSVFWIDELNARLHPLLVRKILLMFLNPKININNAQLVFTSHDIWQLKNSGLREDEIWFTEKDADGISSLYSLVDFNGEIKNLENIEEDYAIGRFGAIPILKKFNMAIVENTNEEKQA